MLRSLTFGALVLFCIASAGTAFAEDFARSGGYVGLSAFGVSSPQAEDELDDAIPFADVDIPATGGLGVYVGSRFHPHFSAEFEFDLVPDQDVEVNGSNAGNIKAYTGTASAKLYLLTGRIQPYLQGGGGVMHLGGSAAKSTTDFVGRVATGVDVYITENLVFDVSLDYLPAAGDLDDYDQVLYGAGIQFRF